MSRFKRGTGTSLMVVDNPQKSEERETTTVYKERKLRYAMPLQAVDNVQTAGVVASSRLLDMLTDEDTWDKMRPSDRLRLIELSMTQAFGRIDSSLQEEKLKGGGERPQQLRNALQSLQAKLPEMKDKA